MRRLFSLFLLLSTSACSGERSTPEPAAPGPSRRVTEEPTIDEPVNVEPAIEERVPLAPGSVGAPPLPGETDVVICILPSPIVGTADRHAIGELALRSDGVLVLAVDGGLRAFDVLEARDCRLAEHGGFGEAGTQPMPDLLTESVRLATDDVGNVWFSDGRVVVRFDGDRALPPVEVPAAQLTAPPHGDFALARVGHTLVRLAGDEVLTAAHESLGATARDLELASFVDDDVLLIGRRGRLSYVGLGGAPIEGRSLAATEETGPFDLDFVRAASAGDVAVASRGPASRVLLFRADGTFARAVGVGSSVEFALEFADPVEGPASLTGLTAIRGQIAYAAFEVVRSGVREGVLVRLSGL